MIENPETYLDSIIDLAFDTSISDYRCSNIGHIFESSWVRPWTDEMKERSKAVKRIAHKNGLRVSYNMVYGELSQWDILKNVSYEVKDALNIFVSPVSWIPTRQFGMKKACFGFFPYIERFDFKYDDSVDINKNLYDDYFQVSEAGFNEIESIRIKILKTKNIFFNAPQITNNTIWKWDELGPRFVCTKGYNLNNTDSNYSSNLSSQDFAKSVLKDLKLLDNYIPKLNMIVSDDYRIIDKAIDILSKRLNVSKYVEIWNNDINLDFYAFSFDDSIIDMNSQHHYFFYWDNKEND